MITGHLPPQSYVFHTRWFHAALRVVRCKRSPKNKYKHVLKEIDPSWPPLGVKIPRHLEKSEIEVSLTDHRVAHTGVYEL